MFRMWSGGRRATFAAILLFATAAAPIAAAGSGAPAAPRPLGEAPGFDGAPERWSELMDLFDVPGLAIAVVKDGQIYAQGFGIRDLESGAPVTPETLFYIASITKTFTATAIDVLADRGKLKIDDPVQKYLPRFQLADSALSRTLTIRDLLCHRYGIDSQPIVMLDAFTGQISDDRYYHWLRQADVKGSTQYTNVHFTILGRVIEAVSGKPWRDFVRDQVLRPARMTRTTGYASALYGDKNHAVPLLRENGTWMPVKQVKTDATMHAAGGMGTSAVEGARWLQLHLQDGTIDGKTILATETARAMRTLDSKLDKPDGSIRILQGYGHAWSVGTFNGHAFCQHGGGYQGASSYVALLPDDHAGVVILINSSGLAQGLGDIVAVEAMERLSGTKASWSVYDRYTARAREMKEKRAQSRPDSAAAAASPAFALSQDMKRYTGAFKNPWWGDLQVMNTNGQLTMQLGGMALDIHPDSASEAFVVEDLLDAAAPAHFVLAPGGKVDGVTLQHPKYGEVVFRR